MFKHILVPTDGSLFSRDAVRKAVSVAKENGAKISALYVKLPPPAHYWSHVIWVNLPEPSAFEEFSEKEAQEALDFVTGICQEAGVECTKTSLTHEHIYQAIIDEATKSNCNLIFMASGMPVLWRILSSKPRFSSRASLVSLRIRPSVM